MNSIYQPLFRLKDIHWILIDAVVFSITSVLALALCFDGTFNAHTYGASLLASTLLFLSIKLFILHQFEFYNRYWRYASVGELVHLVTLVGGAVGLGCVAFYSWSLLPGSLVAGLPKAFPLVDGLLSLLILGGIRFSIRVLDRIPNSRSGHRPQQRVLIVGAGVGGVLLVQDMRRNPQMDMAPVAFIDDDPCKANRQIQGLPVVGNRDRIPQIVEALDISRIIIAMPSAPGEVIREIMEICQKTGVPTSTLPGLNEILTDPVRAKNVREIRIEDLLRREPIQTDFQQVSQFLQGKRVLVTGAGGSIGSEICRQVLKCQPAEIILVGHGENSIFAIQQELLGLIQKNAASDPDCYKPQIQIFIGDIRMVERLEHAFARFRPEIVLHAAAHKHVPLMELNSPEAITNNVLGTKNLVNLALRYDVKNFVMISTDKVVNPTNIMGASKRVGEMVVLQAAQKTGKPFVVVRFGNVLGSRGSVIPTFQRQIAAGGPVTITHPDIHRYFMTIPEAVQLALQAAVVSKGGEVCMLDMGQPVKILDLAKDLIRLSGYEVGKDIPIVFSGLRPGEKLYEELFIPGEQYETTEHEKIIVVRNASTHLPERLMALVEELCQAAFRNDYHLIPFLLERLVLGYTPSHSEASLRTSVMPEQVQPALVHGNEPKAVEETRFKIIQNHTLQFPQVVSDLQQALQRQEFRLHYQPVIRLKTKEVAYFEALLRWQHPEQGLIFPLEFVPVAEQSGLMAPIGEWVLREVCQQIQSWKQFRGAMPITISINLSAQQLMEPTLLEQFQTIPDQYGLTGDCLKLEISADILLKDSAFNVEVLQQLKHLGMQLQLDNFGMNPDHLDSFEQLSHLLYGKFFDALKFDRSLISQVSHNGDSLQLVKTAMRIAKEMNVDIIAAGVETLSQLNQLQSLHFKYGQGYLFSKPVAHEAAELFARCHP